MSNMTFTVIHIVILYGLILYLQFDNWSLHQRLKKIERFLVL